MHDWPINLQCVQTCLESSKTPQTSWGVHIAPTDQSNYTETAGGTLSCTWKTWWHVPVKHLFWEVSGGPGKAPSLKCDQLMSSL